MPIGEPRFDRSLCRFDREVPHNQQGGLGWNIFPPPECPQPFGSGSVQRLLGADRQAPGVPCLRVQELHLIFEIAQRKGISIALFCQDHAAFALDGRLADGQFAGGLAHQHQRRIKQRRIIARQVELVFGVLKPGRGIGIGSERQPQTLQQLDHFPFGNIGAAIEGHVFDKVGKAPFIIGFVQRTGVHDHSHQRLTLWGSVAADDIAQAIVELAEPVSFVNGDVAGLECPGGLGRRRNTAHSTRLGRARRQSRGGKNEGEQ